MLRRSNFKLPTADVVASTASASSATSRRRRMPTRQTRRSNFLYAGIGLLTVVGLLCFVVIQRYNALSSSAAMLEARARQFVSNHKILQTLRGPATKAITGRSTHFPAYPKQSHLTNLSQPVLEMCTRTLWHTLETTTIVLPNHETFVHTGDIDDLWLRDSASQIHPLMVGAHPLIAQDLRLDRVVSGLIKRVARYIRHDPYANAFRIDDTYVFSDTQKALGRHDLISTWNYELDSACFYMRMLYYYWKQSPLATSADSVLRLASVQEAVEIMVDLWIAEQQHELDAYPTGPLLDCQNCHKPYRYPGLPRSGKGSRTNSSAGMTWTGFRPSDDECKFGYLVPANMFVVVVLGYMGDMATNLWQNAELADKAQRLAREIDQGIQEHGIINHPQFGNIYAYEVDGLGNSLLMDDANVPSLMSAPYLGYPVDEQVFSNTKDFVFSEANPTYRQGTNALTGSIEGYGSVHMSAAIQDNIWPMSIAVQGLISNSVDEKILLAEILVKASAGTGWMHESFDVHDPSRYTRSWFCWADSLFAELVMSISDECPLTEHKYLILEWRDPIPVPGGTFAAD